MQSLIYFGGETIYTDVTPESNPKYIKLCDQGAIRLLKDVSKTLGIISICVGLFSIFPMYTLVCKHELQLPIPIFVPFTDISTLHGIVINISNQVSIALLGLSGNYGIEIGTCILKNSVWAIAMAICHSIDELKDLLAKPKQLREIDMEFRNLLIQIMDYDR